MNTTKIEWADAVWNPVTGCTKVSEGCRHCYAEGIANRFWGKRKFTDVLCHAERFGQPSKLKKPSRIFVNSMSDLFHPDVPQEFVRDVWTVMMNNPHHTFMILTKRADRMAEAVDLLLRDGFRVLPNVWLGVSVENQKAADERIPMLLQTPAAVRFVSCEPLLGSVNLFSHPGEAEPISPYPNKLDWVICGGETGPGARLMELDWARSLRDQCQAAEVPFFFKRVGSAYQWRKGHDRLLDGVEWNEFPEVAK